VITWNLCKPLQCIFAQLFCAACLRTQESQLFVKQGRLEPVQTRVKNNKRGLGSKEPKAKPKPKEEDEDVEKDPKKPKVSQLVKCVNLAMYPFFFALALLFLISCVSSFEVLVCNMVGLTTFFLLPEH
jgi:hypothetical protein